jgi:hypothetical protein
MTTGEPIPGAVPPETGSPKPLIFERIAEIQQIQTRTGKSYSNELYEPRKRLTEDVTGLLKGAENISSEEKLQLVTDLVPLVEWGYKEASFGARDEEKAREANDKAASDDRHKALASFLQTIPDSDLSKQGLNTLLDLEENTRGQELFEIRRRVVSAVKNMPPEEAKDFLPRLRPQTTPAGYVRYESEWVEVLSNWQPEEAKPFIEQLVSQIDEQKRDLHAYRVVSQAIEKWPPEQQEAVVRDVLTRHGLNDLWGDSYFRIVKQWDPQLAKPLLRDILDRPVKPRTGVTYADRNYGSLAIAMSNWPPEDMNTFLSDENNTRWIRDVAQVKSQERSISQKSFEENYVQYLNGFKLSSLRERVTDFTDEHSRWIAEGFTVRNGTEAASVVSKHPELFSPEVASRMFLMSKEAGKAIELFSNLPKEEQLVYKSAIADLLMGDDLFDYRELLPRVFNEISQKWAEEEINDLARELLARGRSNDIAKFRPGRGGGRTANAINAYKLLQQREALTDHELIKGVLKYSIGEPDSDEGKAANALVGKIERNEETERLIIDAAGDAIAMKFRDLSQRTASEVYNIATRYELNLTSYTDKLPPYVQSLVHSFGITDIGQLADLFDNQYEFASTLAKTPDVATLVTPEDVDKLLDLHLTLLEVEVLRRAGVDVSQVESEEDFKRIFDTLAETDSTWRDEQSIGNPFREGAEIFGYRRMFTYLDRRQTDAETHRLTLALDLTRHDALHSFEDILDLYNASQMSADQFWGNILNQVRMDDRAYDEGNAHQHFNAIAATANRDVAGVVERVQQYRDITRLQELATLFETPQQVFDSWNNLKRYSELEQVLEQAEILDELKELKAQGKDRLYSYVETLAFHPASKVDMQSVIQFWRDPQSFIEAAASHTPDEVHNRKKPSNYIEIPNLDLTAEELRDALVEGKMDSLQAFSALEIEYDVPLGEKPGQIPLREAMKTALGSRKLGVEGTARSTKKLFSELQTALKPYGLTVQAYLEGTELPEDVDSHQFEGLIYHPEFGMLRPRVASQRYVARINLKSDPEGVLAGNDTANCMPFGDGKTTVYTFNPNTAQFLLQMVREDGTARTVAQSVLTKDMDIGKAVPEVLQKLQQGGHLEEVLPEDVVRSAQAYVACDNIEVAPNYGKQNEATIEAIYRDFFREYVKRFGASQRLVADKAVIGKGYADALTHLPEIPNTFAPQAPVSYSDKTGDNVFVLNLTQDAPQDFFLERTVRVVESEEPPQELPRLPQGLGYLTFEDALRVAYLEGKAYSDNRSLMQYLHNMENCLIAKDINDTAKGRPNMSLKYTDESGKMRGYFLAYEGVLNDEYVAETEEGYDFSYQPVLYLLDLASDKESPMTGGRLINGFVDLYRQNYLEQGNLMPLFMQAREQTSFRIIQRQLEKISRGLGVEFDLIELPTYAGGEDTMHPVIVSPRRMQ